MVIEGREVEVEAGRGRARGGLGPRLTEGQRLGPSGPGGPAPRPVCPP